jgi:hypothetical protein
MEIEIAKNKIVIKNPTEFDPRLLCCAVRFLDTQKPKMALI